MTTTTVSFAVLFDWDGVVVDSSRAHELSWERLAAEEGQSLPEGHFKASFGKVNRVIIPEILGWTDDPGEIERMGRRKEALYREIIRDEGLEPLPGARELVLALRDAGIPRVIGTSTARKNIEVGLEAMGLEGCFDGAVCSEDVSRGKPDPEVFLKAAAVAGMAPERCVVIEDSVHGLEAAKAGGMRGLGVTTTHPRGALLPADAVVDSLTEVSPAFLARLF